MLAFRYDAFSVYVYPETGQQHHLPHCHVRWAEGDTVVALPSQEILAGPSLPKAARRLLLDRMEEICSCWDELNPEVTVQT